MTRRQKAKAKKRALKEKIRRRMRLYKHSAFNPVQCTQLSHFKQIKQVFTQSTTVVSKEGSNYG